MPGAYKIVSHIYLRMFMNIFLHTTEWITDGKSSYLRLLFNS